MNAERWQEIDKLFQAAVELEPARRSAFLDETCAGDVALRREVDSLLSSDDQTWDLIDAPAFEVAADLLADDQPELAVGQQVGHYQVLDLIGTGGMGQVYLAQDVALGRKVALKLLPADFTTDHSRVRRFQQEARAASSLNHPNILTIHEIGLADDQQFIATEFIDGETLRRRMNRSRLSPSEALRIAAQAAEALAAAHAAGIVHRDIKPENIMLRPDGYVKVLDFGLAKLTEQQAQPAAPTIDKADTHPGMIIGTLNYMSPEQARGQEVDARCDIFSLGVVIYEMVAGRPPFEGETNSDLIAAILKVEPPPLAQCSADAPAELQNIVSKALCKERDERYQTIKDLLADIESLKEELGLAAKLKRPVPSRSTSQTTVKTDSAEAAFHAIDESIPATEKTPAVHAVSRAQLLFPRIKSHKTRAAMIVAAIILTLAVGWLAKEKYLQPGKRLAFAERDWVLITSFENRTGEPVFDDTLAYALERELNNSQFVNVVSPERIEDALRLMKKPPDTKVDLAVGKEVCLRDGAIRALLAGRTDKLGSTYVLSANLIDPHQGQTVATHSEEASNQEQIAPAVRRLSNWVRAALGETLSSIKQGDQELEKVTTPSLRALQLYTQAEAGHREKGNAFGEQLFKQAIIEDPNFASAHIMLAWTLHNQSKPNEEWMQASERAFQLSEQVSERERLFIVGSYYMMRDQYDKFLPTFEVLVQRYPDHYWGTNNLAASYSSVGRYEEALAYRTKLSEMRPNDFLSQVHAAELSQRCFQMDDAFRYAKRANDLITPELIKGRPQQTVGVEFFLAYEPWFRGDYEAALRELDRLAQTIDARPGLERDASAILAVFAYVRFGKLRAAQECAEKISPEGHRYYGLALIDFIRNDRPRLRSDLLKHQESPLSRPLTEAAGNRVPLLVRAGLFSEAQRIMSTIGDPGELKVYDGELALAHGQPGKAISLLKTGMKLLRPAGNRWFSMAGYESLATAYERQGDLTNQLRVLEESYNENERGSPAIGFWLKNALQLAQLYRKLNRVEDAQKIEAELLSLLRYADADHPIVRQVMQAQGK